MSRTIWTVLVFAISSPCLAGPGQAVSKALADARRRGPAATSVRYLSLYALPEEARADAKKALAFHVNQLSREAELVSPRTIGDDLLAVSLIDYGWDRKTWDRLADPYFTVQAIVAWPGGYDDGTYFKPGKYRETIAAPWLPQDELAELRLLTQSRRPILRADWFFAQTAIQEGRQVGYYDMLGIGKKRDDFDKLIALNRADATRVRKEIGAIVQSSIVALNNRQIFRFQATTGAYWETRDSKQSIDKNNALRLLNGDYSYDAQEIYGTLPNGLFAFFLGDGQGNRANFAPPEIASDGQSTSTDRRVHIGLSCVRCHRPGIQAIDCWARKTYRNELQLQAVDPFRLLRLKQLYLSDLDRFIKRDQDDYADALKRTNGLSPLENSRLFSAFYSRYNDEARTLQDAVRETGYREEQIREAIGRQVKAGLADPVLAGLIQKPQLPLRLEHWEEAFPILMDWLK